MIRFLIVAALLFIVYMLYKQSDEPFANKKEYARSIVDWFDKNPDPRYVDFKSTFSRGKNHSNVVTYQDALALKKQQKLTVESLQKYL